MTATDVGDGSNGTADIMSATFHNDHGDRVAVVHGYSGMYGVDARAMTLMRRPAPDFERGLVPDRETRERVAPVLSASTDRTKTR